MIRNGSGPPALLVLADGAEFEGEAIGAFADPEADLGVATAEFVFNTALSGYQEVLTDPSYAGQVVTFTYPHIGNYGTNPSDEESAGVHCSGIVVRELARRPSNWRSTAGLDAYLRRHRVPGVAGIDTRRLTRHLRDHGALPGAFGTDEAAVRAAAVTTRGTDGLDLVATVTCSEPYLAPGSAPDAPFSVVAYDFGIKSSILRRLVAAGCRVEVVPASTKADDVLARRPDGVFLSNGPGDPAGVVGAPDAIRGILGEVPVFGICLGHQLLGLALGATTSKLPFGHHGANHPVRRVGGGFGVGRPGMGLGPHAPEEPGAGARRGRSQRPGMGLGPHVPEEPGAGARRGRSNVVAITSQNHNYAVDAGSLEGAEITHVNLNDGVVEGLRVERLRAFSVQFHPEAAPGPHDAVYLFDEFTALMAASR